jgi:hypothetical protein
MAQNGHRNMEIWNDPVLAQKAHNALAGGYTQVTPLKNQHGSTFL